MRPPKPSKSSLGVIGQGSPVGDESTLSGVKPGPRAEPPTPKQQSPRPSPMVGKFVVDEDRGSPVLLIALAGIIIVAVGVILYSFKIL
jgi:hypothetical protein